jgi:hypothetical protein
MDEFEASVGIRNGCQAVKVAGPTAGADLPCSRCCVGGFGRPGTALYLHSCLAATAAFAIRDDF